MNPRLAYGLGVLVGGVTATLGWTWLARHPAGLLARHERQVREWNATHGPGRGLDGPVAGDRRGAGIHRPPEAARRSGAVTTTAPKWADLFGADPNYPDPAEDDAWQCATSAPTTTTTSSKREDWL
jgi:hypothetical protein